MHTPMPKVDGRTISAAARRAQTRNDLIACAVQVFARKGPDLPVIDDFIKAAGIARGTFYNYFQTIDELLLTVATQGGDAVMRVIDPFVRQIDDPPARIATGSRLFIKIAVKYPMWGTFVTRVGHKHGSLGQLMIDYLTRDVQTGIDTGRIRIDTALIARDLALGTIMYGIDTLLSESVPDDYAEQLIMALLQGFGLRKGEARKMAFLPIPAIPAPEGLVFEKISTE